MKKKVCMIFVATMIALSATGCGTNATTKEVTTAEITTAEVNTAEITQEKTEEETTQSVEESVVDYSVFTNLDSQTVQEFATNVQKKVADKDWASLAEDISYPITVGSETFDTAEQLAAFDFDQILTDDFYNAVAKTDCSNLFANAEGAMLGDGQIWFAEILDDDGNSLGLKIITINE